jgi:short-subunit dehydrogenase
MKVIVIGGSSGIGRELAVQYLREGHQVGVTGRREVLLQELTAEWSGRCFYETFDVTGSECIMHLKKLMDAVGGLDLLIYNAGFGDPSEALVPEVELSTVRTNVLGFVEIGAWVFNYFVARGRGQMAVISSVAGVRGGHHAPAYNASKSFVSAYAEGLNIKAVKLKVDVVVTDVRPGFVNTKETKGQFWVGDVGKVVRQIRRAIAKKKRVVYVTRRWRLIAWLLRNMPYWLYRKI